MIGYGLVLADGTKLVDPNDTISGKMEKGRRANALKIIAIPVVYFVLIIVVKIARRKKANKSNQA